MLLAGDELRRTQGGNNNAYCQDNPISWQDWSTVESDPETAELHALVRRLIALRRGSPVLRQRAFFEGRPVPGGDGRKDLAWFRPDGYEMTEAEWLSPDTHTIGMYLDGRGIRQRGPRGERLTDRSYLLVQHGGGLDTVFLLPGPPWAARYEVEVDTAYPGDPPPAARLFAAGLDLPMLAHSAVLLRARR
jgi:glycogen operon protein